MAKNIKNHLFKIHFVTTSKNVRQNPKPFLKRFFLVVFENGIKTLLNGQMTEIIAFEVRPKKSKKLQKVSFLKVFVDHLAPGGSKKNCTT